MNAPTHVQIRPFALPDCDAVEALLSQEPNSTWRKDALHACLTPPYQAWVLVKENKVVGFAALLCQVGMCELVNIIIAKSARQCGYATLLLRALLEKMRVTGVEKMHLEVRASNAPAIACYQQFGFKKEGVRKHYYPAHQGREDAVLMSLAL